jgi:hypothetical protein
MRHYPYYNAKAFDSLAGPLRADGWAVVSPVDLDRADGFEPLAMPPDSDWSQVPYMGLTLRELVARDVEALLTCEYILMLYGWENSVGARAELAVAEFAGLLVRYQRDIK